MLSNFEKKSNEITVFETNIIGSMQHLQRFWLHHPKTVFLVMSKFRTKFGNGKSRGGDGDKRGAGSAR